jgi:hypothetical protein
MAESKVVPPARTDVKYPDVAVIPPGGRAVIMVPVVDANKEVQVPEKPEIPIQESGPIQETPETK